MIKKKITILLSLILVTTMALTASGSKESASSASDKIDFSTWKITIPETREGGTSAKEIYSAELTAGYTSEWFYYNEDGAMVFYCPVGMSSTANSNYSRSELRELIDGEHTNVNWDLHGTHIFNTTEKVTEVPSNGRTVTSQIHGIYPDGTNGPVLVKVEYNGVEEAVVVLLKTATYKNAADERFYLRGIKLGEDYSTTIKVVEGRVFVTVTSGDKKLEASRDFYRLDPTWENYRFYYKVGNYVQDSIKDYEGEAATVVVYGMDTSHTDKIENMPPSAISLPETLNLKKGNDVAVEPTFIPFDTSNTNCTWEIVSGSDVISLSSTGQIAALKKGEAVVRAISTVDNSLVDTCNITVGPKTRKEAKVRYENDFEAGLGSEWELFNAEDGRLTVTDGKLQIIDTESTISMKAVLTLDELAGTSTVQYDVNLTRLDIKDKGNTKEQASYYYFDVNSASKDNLFRIRSKADLEGGELLDPRVVLSRGYLEPKLNKEAAKTPIGSTHTITMVIRTDDHSATSNTTDIYVDSVKVGDKIKNNSKQSSVSRIEIFSGTKDMLDFTIDNLKVYEGEKLPAGASPSEVTVEPVTSYLAVGGSTRIGVDANTTFKVIEGLDVATVSDSGLIIGLKAGTTTIQVGENNKVTLTVVDSLIAPETMELAEELLILNVEESLDLISIVKLLPEDSKEKDFKVSIAEGKDLITLENNIVTANANGKVNLMITSLGNQSIIKFLTISVVTPRKKGAMKVLDFDNLTVGTQIDKADAAWKVEKVDGSTMLAEVSSTFANSGANSLYVLDNSPSNKPYAILNFANGAAPSGTLSFDAYIPSTNPKTVYVNIGTGKNNSQRYFELRLNGSGALQYENSAGDVDVSTFTTDAWHTFTAEWEDGKFTISVDGVPTEGVDVAVVGTGLDATNIPTTVTFYAGDTKSTGTAVYIDNITSDLFE